MVQLPLKVKAFFRPMLDRLLFSNLFIGFCAVAQALVTYHLLRLRPDPYVLSFLFFSTLGIYNLSMLLSKPANPMRSPFRRVRWIFSHHRFIVTITLIAAIAIITLALFYLSLQGKILMGLTGLIAVAYSLPFFTINNRKIGLRNLPGIKLFLIALIWAISTVLFPIIEAENFYEVTIPVTETFLLTAKRFLFIAAITVPFDIRDLFQDKLYELKTIPVMLGERRAHFFCLALLLFYLLLLLLFSGTVTRDVLALSVLVTLTIWLIFGSGIKRNEYYYFFLLDGTMILQYLLLQVFS